MRDRLLRFDEALGDGLAHAVVRHFLVGAGLEHRLDLIAPTCSAPAAEPRASARRRAAAAARQLRRLRAAAWHRGAHVLLDDAAMRAGALDRGEIDAGLLGDALGERRGEDAAAARLRLPAPLGFGGLRRALRSLVDARIGHVASDRPDVSACGCGAAAGAAGRAAAASARAAAPPPAAAPLTLFGSSPSPAITRDQLVDRHVGGAFRHHDLGEDAFVDRLDFHGGLVGLDLGDHVAGLDRVAFLLQPLGEVALFHGGRQGGHQDVDGHGVMDPDR